MFKKINFSDDDHESHEEESWLLTYADTITNLMGFFALLLSMSVIDKNKFTAFTGSVKEQLSNEQIQSSMKRLKLQLDSSFSEQKAAGAIDINMDSRGISLIAKNASFFNSGEANLLQSGETIINQVTTKIESINDHFSIDVEGHTDDAPISSELYPTNWELSAARASNVVKLMIQKGIDPASIKASAFSDTRPIAKNKHADGSNNEVNMSKNRRIVIKIYY